VIEFQFCSTGRKVFLLKLHNISASFPEFDTSKYSDVIKYVAVSSTSREIELRLYNSSKLCVSARDLISASFQVVE
jgi:hypothetical protein